MRYLWVSVGNYFFLKESGRVINAFTYKILMFLQLPLWYLTSEDFKDGDCPLEYLLESILEADICEFEEAIETRCRRQ